jgi:hypothetical protein
MKDFEWQYSDEKLLLKQHENLIHLLLRKFHLFIVYIILSAILFIIIEYKFNSYIISFFISIWIFLILFIYLKRQYSNTWIIITTRRVIKLVRSGIFTQHRKELKLTDIKATTSRRNFFDSIFWYWNIMIQWTEEHSNIYFKWIKGNADIANYLWRVLDYIKLNWHTDNIAKYKTKKSRRK